MYIEWMSPPNQLFMFLFAAILFDSSRVEDIDPFIGMVTEEPIRGAAVGPTAGCIIAHQFYALKYGDRFWYENTEGLQAFTDSKCKKFSIFRLDIDKSSCIPQRKRSCLAPPFPLPNPQTQEVLNCIECRYIKDMHTVHSKGMCMC